MDELKAPRPLAVVTGASSGIGYHLARIAAEHGHDLLIASDTSQAEAVTELQGLGAQVEAIEADLATTQGVQQLVDAIGGRRVDVLMGLAAVVWLLGLAAAIVLQAWPVTVLMIGIGAAAL